jgi:hypothetical protein
MILELRRGQSDSKATLGDLYVDGVWTCYTLEDTEVRGPKIPGETAIPTGLYKVIITMSPKFGRPLPLLVDVPGFDGIRIHPGNTAQDTEGCILLGQTEGKDFIGSSRAAFDSLYPKIEAVLANGGEVWMNVTHA